MNPKLKASLDRAAVATREALVIAIDDQPVDSDLIKRLAGVHGALLAMTAAPPAAAPAKK